MYKIKTHKISQLKNTGRSGNIFRFPYYISKETRKNASFNVENQRKIFRRMSWQFLISSTLYSVRDRITY